MEDEEALAIITKLLSCVTFNYYTFPETLENSLIDEWVDGRTDGRTGGEWLAGWSMDGCVGEWMEAGVNGLYAVLGEWTGWMGRPLDGRAGGPTDG